MIVYLVIFLLLALCSFTDVLPFKEGQRRALLVCVGFLLILFAGLRGDGFPDYEAYQVYFESLRNGEQLGVVASEPGYIAINGIVGFFTSNSVWLFLLMATLAVSINLRSYRDYTPFYFVAVMAYFAHTFLGRELMQIRAGVAAAIVLYSYRFVVGKRFWKFLLWVLVAASIHLGALVVLVVYPISKLKWSPQVWLGVLGVCLVAGTVMPFGALIRQIPEMALLERIQNYSDNAQYAGELGIWTNPTLLKQLFVSVVGLSFFYTLSQRVWGYRVLLVSYLIATCWLILFNDFAILSARVATFFSITEVLLLAGFTYLFNPKSRIIYVIWVILFTFAMLYLNVGGDKIPGYHTIFR